MTSATSSRRTQKSRDPDIQALVAQAGGLFTPRELILQRARRLLERFADFSGGEDLDPFRRIKIIASLAGYDVQEMGPKMAAVEKRDAIWIQTDGARKGRILYNRLRPKARIVFSIGHEISHSFLPVTPGGVRYRTATTDCADSDQELERLCDIGAAELTMPEEDFCRASQALPFDFASIERLQGLFGTSFEATFYRLIQTRDFACAGGLLKFRLKPSEERIGGAFLQLGLFANSAASSKEPLPKYRVQTFSRSDSFPTAARLPTHKSFPESSCVYRVGHGDGDCNETERLPLPAAGFYIGHIQARVAPYQDRASDVEYPDVLFLFKLARR